MQRLATALSILTVLPVFAQEPASTAAAKAPVLTAKTSRMEIAAMLGESLGYTGDLPELADGKHFVVTLGADRQVQMAVAEGDAAPLDLVGDPAAAMAAFAAELDGVKPVVNGSLTMGLQQLGITPKESAAFLKELWAFPAQLQSIHLTLTGDLDDPATGGLDLALQFQPKAEGAFAQFCKSLQPCAEGVPVLPVVEGTAMWFSMSLAPERMATLLAPLMDLTVAVTHQGDEDRARAKALYRKSLDVYDGTFAMDLALPFRGRMVMGLRDGAAMQKLIESEEYVAVLKSQKMQQAEVEVLPNAFEHRGVKVLKSTANLEQPNPMLPAGGLVSMFGVAGTWFAGTLGAGEPEAKRVLDAALDGKVQRAKLAAGELLKFGIDVPNLVGFLMEQQGMGGSELPEDTPAQVLISLASRENGLRLAVHVK